MKTQAQFGIVDLFSGPGGLGEGFSSVVDEKGKHVFEIETSIEFDAIAHQTLRLRSFLRKFNGEFPQPYYDWINGKLANEPDWASAWPNEWQAACEECRHLELGTDEARAFLAQRIPEIREKRGDAIVLIGGPPCQAYSLAGRGRKPDTKGYVPHPKDRHLLYREYINVLRTLRPAAFVMENVKGLLSSQVDAARVVEEVLKDLREGGGSGPYIVFPVGVDTPEQQKRPRPQDFVVRAERYGVPQTRHRVIIVGIRADLYLKAKMSCLPILATGDTVTVAQTIYGLPKLRSGLSHRSGAKDSAAAWSDVVRSAARRVREYAGRSFDVEQKAKFDAAIKKALASSSRTTKLPRTSQAQAGFAMDCPPQLQTWLHDSKIITPSKHDTREHMPADLARYLFAAAWTEATGTPPKANDFPAILAPEHASWQNGFADRFRVQASELPASTITCHISKDGHYFIHPDPGQVRSLTVREAARIQTFPDNYHFMGTRTQAYVQVGNAVPPFLARQIASVLAPTLQAIFTSMTATMMKDRA